MAITSKRVVTIRSEDWEEGSSVTIRAEKSRADDRAIERLTYQWVIDDIPEPDMAAIQRGARRGEDPVEAIAKHMRREMLADRDTALLQHMIQSWTGPEFSVPADYPASFDEQGKPGVDEEGNVILHELAGQVCPITAEWIDMQDGDVIAHILKEARHAWAGRTPDEAASFRPGREATPRSGSGRKPRGGARATPATAGADA